MCSCLCLFLDNHRKHVVQQHNNYKHLPIVLYLLNPTLIN